METPNKEQNHYVKDPRMLPIYEKHKHSPKKRKIKDDNLNESTYKKQRTSERQSSNERNISETKASKQVDGETSTKHGNLNGSDYKKSKHETKAPKQLDGETSTQHGNLNESDYKKSKHKTKAPKQLHDETSTQHGNLNESNYEKQRITERHSSNKRSNHMFKILSSIFNINLKKRPPSNKEQDRYVKDPRMPCKFGIRCFQKNRPHQVKYKHPPPITKETEAPNQIDGEISTHSCHKTNNQGLKILSSIFKTFKKRATDKKEQDRYVKDPRMPCKFGIRCFQNNRPHHVKYKHRPAQRSIIKDCSLNEKTHEKQSSNQEKFDMKHFIKKKFLFEMPNDFYSFWDLCKSLKNEDPSKAFLDVGLELVGPYDVLAGKFSNVAEKSKDEYLIHWRYYYDPPEFQTVIKGSDATQYHIGYIRDDPSQLPVFVASNYAKMNGEFKCMGENIFAAVNIYLKEMRNSSDAFKKAAASRLRPRLKARAKELKFDLSEKTKSITKRNKKILSPTFNKIGLVVPYEKKTHCGYRHLSVSDQEFKKLLDLIGDSFEQKRSKVMWEFQNILIATNNATAKRDFGTGIELGWDILASGVDCLNYVTEKYLTNSYRLFQRDEFAQIVSAHMKNRKNDNNLSIL